MLWQFLVAIAAFFTNPFDQNAPHSPDDRWTPLSNVGPQNIREDDQARTAIHGKYHGGDMLFSDDFKEAGIKDERFRWPGYPGKAEVPYVIDGSLMNIKPLIEKAIQQYHDRTCIKFVPKTNQKNYINLVKGRGCSSYVGLINRGGQPVNLGSGCEYVGTIVHELGHAIGLFHEHQRSDRDQYINVYKQNVTGNQWHNFEKTNPNQELIFTQYNYNSIMHYGEYAFSVRPRQLKTMVAKNGVKLLEPYDKAGLTDSDVDMVRKLYKCT